MACTLCNGKQACVEQVEWYW